MPELDLEELEKLAAAATPGPWTEGRHDMKSIVEGCPAKYIYSPLQAVAIACGEDVDWNQVICNAEYIVAACNAVPELIKMCREADDEAYEANEAWKKLRVEYITLHDRVQKLEKEKNSLEFALKSVLCDLIELNPAYCGPCHGCKDGKKVTPLLCQTAMLEAYKEEAGEEEC